MMTMKSDIELAMVENYTLVEPVPIPDTFATGVEVDYHSEFVRLTYWSEHPLAFGSQSGVPVPIERHIVAKLVLPRAAFERAVQRFLAQRSRRPSTAAGRHDGDGNGSRDG